MSPVDLVLEFVEAINAHHVDKLVSLMAPDHCFTDSLGHEIQGRMAMRDAWTAYLRMIPDYRIDVDETLVRDDLVVIVGSAGGTYACDGELRPANRWSVPAVWTARVADGRLARWQAFVDNEPLRRIMQHCGTAPG